MDLDRSRSHRHRPFVLTLIWPQWIEGIFEVSPDGGDGSFEILSSAILGAIAAVTATDAIVAWRKTHQARRAGGGNLAPE
jgi:hypothetical protein